MPSDRPRDHPRRVNLIAWDNGVGLGRDLRLLARHLAAVGVQARILAYRRDKPGKWLDAARARLRGLLCRVGLAPRADANLHLEHIRPEYRHLARRNLLVPNPEWFGRRSEQLLGMIDGVLAKTRQAEHAFAALGRPVAFCGFTSEDRLDTAVERTPTFFHLAGRSLTKGTAVLLETWRRHPEWPPLTVVQSPDRAAAAESTANIEHRVEYLDDVQLRSLQNRHLFHLCPSEAEGFGHHLVEALSVGAIVLVTDGAPMNELVSPERGILIPWESSAPLRRGVGYRVAVAGIERAVEQALALDAGRRQALSAAARAFYLANDAAFPARLRAAIEALL
ncbi:MAG: glycosyltransferase [Pseudoxanthomonas sp.]